MSDTTYIELRKNDKSTIELDAYELESGAPFSPSGAFYSVRGSEKDNILIPKSLASVSGNQIYVTITQAITSSAAQYDLHWEIHKDDGDIANHCTKILVKDC